MKGALKKLEKLKGRGLDELRVRGAQALAARAERLGVGARLPSDEELSRLLLKAPHGPERADAESLLAHFRRAPRAFFKAFADPEATRAELRRRFDATVVTERAERAAAGRFDLLGHKDLSFGEPLDWNFEPVAGKRSPMIHWSGFVELDAETAGDKKIIWELNRHQHFLALGRAYWHTGDEAHARAFAAHLASWMEQHPPKLGVNWMSSLEVAFRSISWLWALHFFKDSPHLTPELYARALKYLYLNGRHLETYLSTYYSPNTHLTGEALGLYYLGACLPELRRAARWRETGRRVLVGELARQVRPDGVYFEQASYYQRYTADFYAHFLLLARAAGEPADAEVSPKLAALCDHLMHLTAPDGTTPFYGDDDAGRLAPLDDRPPADFRATLVTAAVLHARADYKYVAGSASEETLWLCGAAGLEAFDALDARPPAEGSRAFAEGGYYVMRDGWTEESNYLLLDCGPHGAMQGGHAHADALSFTLAARGRTLFVDSGTCSYTGSRELRDHFRHTAAHNALVVDGESSSVAGGTFSWTRTARCEAREWLSRARFDFFEGEQDGYRRLPDPVTHRRSVLFLKGDYFVIRDEADARARHRYALRFHLAPEAPSQVESGESAVRLRDPSAPGVELHARGGGGRWRESEDWVSPCYGARVAAPVWTFEAEGEGPQDFLTLVLPRAAGAGAARVSSLEQEGAAHFLEVEADGARDLLVVGRAGRVISARQFVTDFAWTWVRLGSDGRVSEAVLVGGGTRFTFGGRELLASGRRLRCAVGRAVEGRLEFQSEPEGFDERDAVGKNGDEVIVDGALKRRDKLSKEGRGPAARETAETPHSRRGS
ncbi:MAG TPA: alginate lyase family protein [Pyrinomonadaceae bacterium]|nr:alginate lyase family protein [Pyrinomonadaceae bacterium]